MLAMMIRFFVRVASPEPSMIPLMIGRTIYAATRVSTAFATIKKNATPRRTFLPLR